MTGGSPAAVKGPTYYATIHFCLGHGPMDKVTEIRVDNKVAWTGSVSTGSLTIDEKKLFGGLKREGGIKGEVEIHQGGSGQAPIGYLSNILGAIPAYRGVVSAVLKDMYLGRYHYLKPWQFLCTRIHTTGAGATQWQDDLSEPITDLINGVHVIRECLTDISWGRGLSTAHIDEVSFLAAAQTCYDEGLGFAFYWTREASLDDFIQEVLKHIQGSLYQDRQDGKFHLNITRLIPEVDIPSLLLLDESNVTSVKRFTRKSVGDLTSSLTVSYINNGTHKEDTVTVTDNALFAKQGAPTSETVEYEGVATQAVAQLLASRDLQQRSVPLYTCTINCNRDAENLNVGDAFRLLWEDYYPTEIIMRVSSMKLGTPTKLNVSIECVQDMFAAPDTIYSATPASNWVDPLTYPVDISEILVQEVPYYSIAKSEGDAFAQSIATTESYISLAAIAPSSDSIDATVMAAGTNLVYEETEGTSTLFFCGTGTLDTSIDKEDTTLSITNIANFESIVKEDGTLPNNSYIQIGTEILALLSISQTSMTVYRGVLDTVPESHSAGDRFYDISGSAFADTTTYLIPETRNYKVLTSTTKGTLLLVDASNHQIITAGRLHRPYPPFSTYTGSRSVTLTKWAADVNGQVRATWVTANRVQQTASVLNWYRGGASSTEVGQTASATLIRTDTQAVLDSFTGNTLAEHYFTTTYGGEVKLSIWTVRDGLNSFQTVTHTFTIINTVFDTGVWIDSALWVDTELWRD